MILSLCFLVLSFVVSILLVFLLLKKKSILFVFFFSLSVIFDMSYAVMHEVVFLNIHLYYLSPKKKKKKKIKEGLNQI